MELVLGAPTPCPCHMRRAGGSVLRCPHIPPRKMNEEVDLADVLDDLEPSLLAETILLLDHPMGGKRRFTADRAIKKRVRGSPIG